MNPGARLWSVQTPQVFRRDILEKAYEHAMKSDRQFTDDSAVVESFTDLRIRLIRNPGPNPKLTYLEDLKLIGALYQLSDT